MSSAESGSLESDRSTRSRSSRKSGHSVKDVVDPAASKPGVNKGKAKSTRRSTPRTSWTAEETDEFIRLLLLHRPSAGDGNFKEETYNQIAAELNGKFPGQRVLKTGRSCRSKWSNIKSEFTVVSGLRAASGFHYDDTNGAVVDDATRAPWTGYCRSHPAAAKYENNPWPYWDDVLPLMSTIPRQSHVFLKKRGRRQQKATSATAAGPSGSNAASDTHEPMVVDEPANITSAAPLAQASTISTQPVVNPNSIPPETPSTYLARAPSSHVSKASTAMTSVSQKRKVSSIVGSNVESEGSQTRKRSRPPSAAAQAKAEGSAMIQRLSRFLDDVDPSVLKPVTLASLGIPQSLHVPPNPTTTDNDYIEQAADILMSFNLGPSENNDLADYMSDPQNKKKVQFFLKFDTPSRELWIKNALAEIQAKRDSEEARRSMDTAGQY